jgi:hypothetical protein
MSKEADLIIQAGQNITNAAIAATQSQAKMAETSRLARSDAHQLMKDGLSGLSDVLEDRREIEASNIDKRQAFNADLLQGAIDNVNDPDTLQKLNISELAENIGIKNFNADTYAKAQAAKQQQFADIVKREQKVDTFNKIQDDRTTDDIWRQFKELNGHLSAREQKDAIGLYMNELRSANPGLRLPEDIDLTLATRIQALDRGKAQLTLSEYQKLQKDAWDIQGNLRIANAAYKNAEVNYKSLEGDKILEKVDNNYWNMAGERLFSTDQNGRYSLDPNLDVLVDIDWLFDDTKPAPYAREQVIRHVGEISKVTRKHFPNGRMSTKFGEKLLQPLETKVKQGKASARERAQYETLKEAFKDPRNMPVLNSQMANTIMSNENFYKEKNGFLGWDWGWRDISRFSAEDYAETFENVWTDPDSGIGTAILHNMYDQVQAKNYRNQMQMHTNRIGSLENSILDIGFGRNGEDLGNRAAKVTSPVKRK